MIYEYLFLSLQDLNNNRLRSLLSIIGIVIGVAVVYTILSLADISQYAIKQQLTGKNGVVTLQFTKKTEDSDIFSNQIQSLFENNTTIEYYFTNEDLTELQKMNGVLDTLGNYRVISQVLLPKTDTILASVIRYSNNYNDFYDIFILAGQDFQTLPHHEEMSSVLVDTNFTEALEIRDETSIIGSSIHINNRIFTIIGVIENESINLQPNVYLSESSYDSIFSKGTIHSISLKIDANYTLEQISEEAIRYLNQKYQHEGKYEVQDLSYLISQITSITGLLSIIMSFIALISLAVAGIGVMNIMYVSVIERTKEIGIKRAIGASKKAIQLQFIIESCTLTFIGGLLGTLLGIGIIQLAFTFLNFYMPLNLNYILYALLFSISIGFVFGYLPAKKAANLNIIDAINRE